MSGMLTTSTARYTSNPILHIPYSFDEQETACTYCCDHHHHQQLKCLLLELAGARTRIHTNLVGTWPTISWNACKLSLLYILYIILYIICYCHHHHHHHCVVAGQCAASVTGDKPADAGHRLQQGHHKGLDEWPHCCLCISVFATELLHLICLRLSDSQLSGFDCKYWPVYISPK